MANIVLVVSLILGVAVLSAQGLKCYTCEGQDSFVKQGDCGDTYVKDPAQLKMCNATAGEIYCRKDKTGANSVFTYLTRECASECEDTNIAYTHRVTCCKEDGCNAAGSILASLSLIVTAVIAKFL